MQRITAPTAILVGLGDDLAASATAALMKAGVRVLRVRHVAGAAERIPVVMPGLVVTLAGLRAGQVETLADRCVAVGAEIVELSLGTSPACVPALARTFMPLGLNKIASL